MRLVTPYWTAKTLTSDIFDEMQSFFDDARLDVRKTNYDERSFGPACEVSESDEHFYMNVDLPGMKKKDIKIEFADNILTVSGERRREVNSEKKTKVQLYEKSYGFFKRSFNLPTTIDESKIEARYENGVLELYLPKTAAAKPRQIEIATGKTGIFDKLLGGKKDSAQIKDVASS